MSWDVEYTNEFEIWWETLTENEQIDIAAHVELLEQFGPNLKFPYSSGVKGSKHGHMRELRVQHKGNPHRVLYAYDPRRVAILLIGGDKKGHNSWYEKYIPIADRLYTEHLTEIEEIEIE